MGVGGVVNDTASLLALLTKYLCVVSRHMEDRGIKESFCLTSAVISDQLSPGNSSQSSGAAERVDICETQWPEEARTTV